MYVSPYGPPTPKPTGVCPGCGRCQQCGQPAPVVQPWRPWVPGMPNTQPAGPYWYYSPNITVGDTLPGQLGHIEVTC